MFAFKCRCSLAWELANLIIILNTQPRPTQFASSELFIRQGQWREMLPESSSKIAVSKSHQKKLSKLSARLQSLLKELSNEIDLTARRLIDRQIDCGLVIKWIVLTIGKLIHQMGEMQSIEKHACRFSQLSTAKSIYFRLDFFGKHFSLSRSFPSTRSQWVGFLGRGSRTCDQ